MDTAEQYFRAKLAFHTDVTDVHTAMESGEPGFVLVDSRGVDSWRAGRIPGAVHLPTDDIAAHAERLLPAGTPVVVYCWGPGCNGATRAAVEFARLGRPVREMLGGFEYWVREGFAVETDTGLTRRPADPLTAPPGMTCAC
ncbi:rhodanese-related sulfurtransferase [Stackebrandtia albiflava]|uniref:Rhodanese-related sulfurtransferase n=1 Tax=Stackebrandtia albiflava TaxID=406432 RepID=A0A562VC54_9ACTN|nr:rhodanese-like domain-containing protein [Stackebrandtia albiflava]TWJ15459.1 rhodanese-related sulfurtransferase [Stackebrandtia albiflava]